MIGTHFFLVAAVPSSDTISANSGLFATIATPFEVSIEEPPPIAIIKSASDALNKRLDSCNWYGCFDARNRRLHHKRCVGAF